VERAAQVLPAAAAPPVAPALSRHDASPSQGPMPAAPMQASPTAARPAAAPYAAGMVPPRAAPQLEPLWPEAPEVAPPASAWAAMAAAAPAGMAEPWQPRAAPARAETVREAPAQAEDAGPGAASGVVEGRLEIDGAALGRWIAEHLAREAGRPPQGMTGVDPRLGLPWAGALQG